MVYTFIASFTLELQQKYVNLFTKIYEKTYINSTFPSVLVWCNLTVFITPVKFDFQIQHMPLFDFFSKTSQTYKTKLGKHRVKFALFSCAIYSKQHIKLILKFCLNLPGNKSIGKPSTGVCFMLSSVV